MSTQINCQLIFIILFNFQIHFGAFEQTKTTATTTAATTATTKDDRIIEYKDFHDFKVGLGRKYNHKFEERRSHRAYLENLDIIRRHNLLYRNGNSTYRLRANIMADLDQESFLAKYVKLMRSKRFKNSDSMFDMVGSSADQDVPQELDWRDKGFSTGPDNQGKCGSCYAFSVAQSMSGQIFKRTGHNIQLSEQQIVDCSVRNGNKGCTGGSLRNTLRYLEETGGLMRRQDYEYQEKQGTCQFIRELSIVNVSSWSILPSHDEDALQVAVALVGPIAVSLNAKPNTFQLYSDGIYDDPQCTSDSVNHAMLCLGYTKDYWILKNWWGSEWGDNGYMKLRRGKNLCGISNYAAYAVV